MGYTKHTWEKGEVVTPDKLNNIEQGVADAAAPETYVKKAEVTQTGTSNYDVKITFTNQPSGGAAETTTIFDMTGALATKQDALPTLSAGKYLCVNAAGTGLQWDDPSTSGVATWGKINGTLADQTDLNTALDTKVDKTTTINDEPLSSNIVLDGSKIKTTAACTSAAEKAIDAAFDLKQDKIADGTPGYYLRADASGKPEWHDISAGIFTAGNGIDISSGVISAKANSTIGNITIDADGIKVTDDKFVPYERKINSKDLGAADVTLMGSDIVVSSSDSDTIDAALGKKLPNTVTINGKLVKDDPVLVGADLAVSATDTRKIDVALGEKQDILTAEADSALNISTDNKIKVLYDDDTIKLNSDNKLTVASGKYIPRLSSTTANKVIVSADNAGLVKEAPIYIDGDAKITGVAELTITGTDWSNVKNAASTNNTLKDTLDKKQDSISLGDGLVFDATDAAKILIKEGNGIKTDTNGLRVDNDLSIATITTSGAATLNSATITANTAVGGDLTVTGKATITDETTLNKLSVADEASFTKDIKVATTGNIILGAADKFTAIKTAGDTTTSVQPVILQDVLDKKIENITLVGNGTTKDLTERVDQKLKITLLEMANTVSPTEAQKEAEKCDIPRPDSIRALIETYIAEIKSLYTYKEVTDAADFPTAAITDGGIHIIVSDLDPTQRYDGYIYLTKK